MSRLFDDELAEPEDLTAPTSREQADEATRIVDAMDQADGMPSLPRAPMWTPPVVIGHDILVGDAARDYRAAMFEAAIGGTVREEHQADGVRVIDRIDLHEASVVEFKTSRGTAEGNKRQRRAYEAMLPRHFHPSHDLAAALDEGQLTRAAWGTMNVGHPIVVGALREAEIAEVFHRKFGAAALYRCDACLTLGDLTTFSWAGALFIHLLTCPNFGRRVAND